MCSIVVKLYSFVYTACMLLRYGYSRAIDPKLWCNKNYLAPSR